MDATRTNTSVVTPEPVTATTVPDEMPVEVSVRRIRPDEALLLRSLRVMALSDEPDAFAGTVADESVVPLEEWAARARDCADRDDDFVAVVNRFGTPSGLVRAYAPPSEPDQRELSAMWVAPWARGIGAGDALVEAVLEWAAEVGACSVTLWVNAANAHARRLYERHGFAAAGDPQDGDGRRWLSMCRPLPGQAVAAGHSENGAAVATAVVGSRARW